MTTSLADLLAEDASARSDVVVQTLVDAFDPLMRASPDAFRRKFRTMARDPFAFYRGSAALFYADVDRLDDPWVDDASARVWIQGDLHAENLGTYMDSDGRLVFDVNDFDEAYLGHWTWDVQRFVASLALLCWSKALPDVVIDDLVARFVRAYVDQVHHYVDADADAGLVGVQVEGAIAGSVGDDVDGLVRDLTDFAHQYAARARADHRLFVDAFRAGAFAAVAPLSQ